MGRQAQADRASRVDVCWRGFSSVASVGRESRGSRPRQLRHRPPRIGPGITGAFEGWFKNPDGTFSLLLGYFNRNTKEELDIPIGPNNRIEPGGPDQGQPTHFLAGRQWGVFTVTVPKDFGDRNKLTWTLTANGQTNVIPLSLNPLWEVSPFKEEGIGNTPPFISFEKGGPSVQGPRPLRTSLAASFSDPLPLNVWVSDDAKTAAGAQPQRGSPVTITWSQLRGPGKVVVRQREARCDARIRRRERGFHRQSHHQRHLQRARRIRAACDGQRLVRRRRARVPVLLDEWRSEGHGPRGYRRSRRPLHRPVHHGKRAAAPLSRLGK